MAYYLNRKEKKAYRRQGLIYYGSEKGYLEDGRDILVIVLVVIVAISVGFSYLLSKYDHKMVDFVKYIIQNWMP